MGNDEFLKQLRDRLLEEAASNLTAKELEEFMSAPANTSPDTLERLRKEFVEKVFEKHHQEPVRDIESDMTLGQWLEMARKKAHLTPSFIATALGETPSFVEQLEKGDILPCDISASTGANIATLFRIHFSAFSRLTANSYKALEHLLSSSPNDGKSGQGSNASPLKSASSEETDGMMKGWLAAVRNILQEKPVPYLLN